MKKRLEDAKNYISMGMQEGYFDQDQFVGMTDEELIDFSEYQGAKGDAMANDQDEHEERNVYNAKYYDEKHGGE